MSELRTGDLFAGYGGLAAAVNAYFGAETAWCSEIEPAACAVLAHHHPEIPNHGDIAEIDFGAVEPVDILCGGSPCQDVSAAGRRKGLGLETRSGLWAQFVRAIDTLRPRYVVFENVRGLLSTPANREEPDGTDSAMGPRGGAVDDRSGAVLRAAGAVLGDLADLGYDAQWVTVPAAAVGACHLRNRVFILASDTSRDGRDERRAEHAGIVGRPGVAVSGAAYAGLALLPTVAVADATGSHKARGGERGGELLLPGVAEAYAANSLRLLPTVRSVSSTGICDHGDGGKDLQTTIIAEDIGTERWGPYAEAVVRAERALGRAAPSPTEPNRQGNPRLSARFAEWMMMLPDGWVTDPAIGLSRNQQLKLCGNGVVPLQAYYALSLLAPLIGVAA